MAITLGDAFQNWNKDSNVPTNGATVDGGGKGAIPFDKIVKFYKENMK